MPDESPAPHRRYGNPVLPGFHPDPSLCRVGEDYYLVTSSFEYFPGIPLYHSRDLVHWRALGHCLDRESQLALAGCAPSEGIWAPTIRHDGSRFYVTSSNVSRPGGGPMNFIISAEDPAGPWSEPVWIGQDGIDPSLLFDEDGAVYYTSAGILQSRIDPATGRIHEGPRRIWTGTGAPWTEGPHLYRMDDTYLLLVAAGGTHLRHRIQVARGDSPWGPFEARPGDILSHRNRPEHPIQATGHGELVRTPEGAWWIVFLGIRPRTRAHFKFHHLGRETFLAPVTWDADGWPVAGADGLVELSMEGPLPAGAPVAPEAERDDFDEEALAPCWNFLRRPPAGRWSLTERPGHLRLRAAPDDPARRGDVAFAGRRQQHAAFRAETRLAFDPASSPAPEAEAGLSVWMNEEHRYDLMVTTRGGRREAVLRLRLGELSAEAGRVPLGEGPVRLLVEGEDERYRFLVREEGQTTPRPVGAAETRFLASEVAGGFTGVYLAMLATDGAEDPAKTPPADFDWFAYAPSEA